MHRAVCVSSAFHLRDIVIVSAIFVVASHWQSLPSVCNLCNRVCVVFGSDPFAIVLYAIFVISMQIMQSCLRFSGSELFAIEERFSAICDFVCFHVCIKG